MQEGPNAGAGIVGCIVGIVFLIIALVPAILVLAGMWKVFSKAGRPSWAAIIPIYNAIVLLDVVGKPIWWFILYFVPIVNFVIAIVVMFELAKCFGRGVGTTIGLIVLPFIFWPILGFGSAEYQGAE